MELEEDTKPSVYSPVHSPIGSSTAPTVSPRATLAMVSPAERLSWVLEEISSIPDFRNSYRKLLHALSRRIRLLSPLADELLDRPDSFPVPAVQTLEPLVIALEEAKKFLKFANEGSKIYLVLESETVIRMHQNVISKLEEALSLISFEELDISDEVKEQVELVRTQLRRAKERNNEIPNDESQLHQELLEIYNDDSNDQNALKNLSSKLHLTTINELMQESLALHEMVAESFDCSDPGENIEKMSMLLKKIKDFIQTQNPKMGTLITPVVSVPDRKMKNTVSVPVPVPDEFRCPISLELMRDPVIVATGQTYERSSIEKWLSTGHDTCPTTHQKLAHKTLTTNYILKSLISHFCETHNLSLPPLPPPPSPLLSPRTDLETLLAKLQSTDLDSQRSASGELRLLAKRNASNRISIARAGAVPILTPLLFSRDSRTQEHAVTALLNLSIFEENKSVIINSNSVPGIVHVLREGNMEARENAAATLFSLSVVDEYKVVIGTVGTAIPALVRLLSEGSNRGKKDAATALFNLCIYQGNKAKAVRAGLVPLVMGLVADSSGTMVDESMAILAILSGNNEGRVAIGTEETVPVLVEAVRNGTPRNRENAAAVLVNICEEEGILGWAEECGLLNPLRDLAVNGTERGKRKAVLLLEKMSRFLVLKQEISSSSLETRDNVNVDNVL